MTNDSPPDETSPSANGSASKRILSKADFRPRKSIPVPATPRVPVNRTSLPIHNITPSAFPRSVSTGFRPMDISRRKRNVGFQGSVTIATPLDRPSPPNPSSDSSMSFSISPSNTGKRPPLPLETPTRPRKRRREEPATGHEPEGESEQEFQPPAIVPETPRRNRVPDPLVRPRNTPAVEPVPATPPPNPTRELKELLHTSAQSMSGPGGQAHSVFLDPKTSKSILFEKIATKGSSRTGSHFNSGFHITRRLGEGNFAFTYQVEDRTGKRYAVKRTRSSLHSKARKRKVVEEIYLLWRLKGCDHIVEIVNAWEELGTFFIQLSLCDGGTLEAWLEKHCTQEKLVLSEEQIWRIVSELALGLVHIHRKGVMHLDIKPANVLITNQKQLVIGDFGLATTYPPEKEIFNLAERDGDALYMAPETLGSWDMTQFTPAADMFSLGLLVLEIAANIMLPDQGSGYQALRHENLVPIMESSENFRGRSADLRTLVKDLIRRSAPSRPSAHTVLSMSRVEAAVSAKEEMEKKVGPEGEFGALAFFDV